MPTWWLLILAIAIAAPALLLAVLPRRWLAWAMLGWLLLPFIATSVVTIWEAVVHHGAYPIGTAFYGLALVFPIVAVPWVVSCGIGFALGFRLNRLRRSIFGGTPQAVPAALVPTAVASLPPAPRPAPPQPPMGPVANGWRAVHVGFENDQLTIDGFAVWQHHWRDTGGGTVMLPHPSYPAQTHQYECYEIGEPAAPVRFAAGELSNGVWGFYVPTDRQAEQQAVSADGSLRFRPQADEPADAQPTTSALLIDAATGEVLLDCAGWSSSRISARPDGSLLLHVGQNMFETMFRIDPAARRFTVLGTAAAERPLSELRAAVGDARKAAEQHGRSPAYRRFSPDGTIRVDLEGVEWSNSHWVNSPLVTLLPSGAVALDLRGTAWDAQVSFPRPACVRLGLRSYRHRGHGLAMELDLARGSYQILDWPTRGEQLPPAPLAGCAAGLDALFPTADPRFGQGPPRKVAWRAGLLILLGAVAAIAAASVVSTQLTPRGLQITPMVTVPRFEPPPTQRR